MGCSGDRSSAHVRTPAPRFRHGLFGHRRSTPKGWSIYGAQRAQPVATGGKCDGLENGSNNPIRNGWQPTATVSERMVRRGSTFRVRQRALQKRRTSALSRSVDLLFVERAVAWSRLWSVRVQNGVARTRAWSSGPARPGSSRAARIVISSRRTRMIPHAGERRLS